MNPTDFSFIDPNNLPKTESEVMTEEFTPIWGLSKIGVSPGEEGSIAIHVPNCKPVSSFLSNPFIVESSELRAFLAPLIEATSKLSLDLIARQIVVYLKGHTYTPSSFQISPCIYLQGFRFNTDPDTEETFLKLHSPTYSYYGDRVADGSPTKESGYYFIPSVFYGTLNQGFFLTQKKYITEYMFHKGVSPEHLKAIADQTERFTENELILLKSTTCEWTPVKGKSEEKQRNLLDWNIVAFSDWADELGILSGSEKPMKANLDLDGLLNI